jgi:quercetin dioxygenase-like cupin family protein
MSFSGDEGNMNEEFGSFDLAREIAACEGKKPWQSGLYSKTLFKKDDFRVVLIAMENSAKMKEHHADGTISVQVLQGQIRVHAQGKTYDLRPGNLFTLGASIKHDVESIGDSAFLLTISWPKSSDLRAMEHRGYGT